jgi:hypothetical protein
MAYKHDIFVSYRRHPETCLWITEHFVPLLELRVEFELGRKPKIYVDDQVETGASWPASLGAALGASRILIPLWTGNYLNSVWCTEELSHMLVRESEEKLRTLARPHGVIVPAFIHDGERFPPALQHIKPLEIQKTFNVRMARNSPRAEELDSALTAQAAAIAACIQHAPSWRKEWPKKAAARFFKKFHERADALQKTVPRFTAK